MNRVAKKMLEFKSEKRAKWENYGTDSKILEHSASTSLTLGKSCYLLDEHFWDLGNKSSNKQLLNFIDFNHSGQAASSTPKSREPG